MESCGVTYSSSGRFDQLRY
ncbi:hypothetical protein CCACVL1_23554 [Corchorus capsularis]|uniref:Uncharacterized protein n=1 Tax=Corchorus capsularis TaxID=210143 RepID=A0A1R3GTH9_COCAP|nr:hypothetical protein CCACVL1_23554 [Corchorus capsularis]